MLKSEHIVHYFLLQVDVNDIYHSYCFLLSFISYINGLGGKSGFSKHSSLWTQHP